MFFLLGISISVFLEFLLLIKKQKSHADKILAIWLLLISLHQLYHYLFYSGELYNYPHWLGIEFPAPILHGVILFLYVLEITGHKLKKGSLWLHIVPALSTILLAIPFFRLSGEEKIMVFQSQGVGFEWYLLYHNILVTLSGLFYSIWSLILIKKHKNRIQNRFSNTDKKELQWLQYLTLGMGTIWIIAIFFDSSIIFFAVVIFVLFIGFFGINQMNIFNKPIESVTTVQRNTDSREVKRYQKSGLNESMSIDIYSRLQNLMKNDLLFKDNELTLSDLAKKLNVHSNHVSQVINEKEQKNFYYYINSLRIQEFIRIATLPENEKYTLLSIAYDCGFNSKSTFNKHFKIVTGKTPTDYFKNYSAENK